MKYQYFRRMEACFRALWAKVRLFLSYISENSAVHPLRAWVRGFSPHRPSLTLPLLSEPTCDPGENFTFHVLICLPSHPRTVSWVDSHVKESTGCLLECTAPCPLPPQRNNSREYWLIQETWCEICCEIVVMSKQRSLSIWRIGQLNQIAKLFQGLGTMEMEEEETYPSWDNRGW